MYCYGTEPFYSQDSYSAQFQVILQQLPIGALHMHKYILLESIQCMPLYCVVQNKRLPELVHNRQTQYEQMENSLQ